ncbi:hypothetical protein N7456_011403 [Penicillium angulare]|uniref:Uncharacterized protein n=1 Tax=Penicillium angulare TaxID=116970 RepID=A0A9W9ETL1_9EURO|nr:hypothetical protein N7456_011403 [Penicillium angulare]
MVNCGFNTLVPALVFQLRIFSLYPIGELSTGGIWSNGNGVGTLTSVAGSDLYLNANTIHMDDFNVVNPDKPYTLNAQGLLATDDGHYIGIYGKGLLPNTDHVRSILANETDVEPTKWGELDAYTTWSFQASGKYAALTESVYVANIKIYPSDDSDTMSYIDYRLSKVEAGPRCNSEWEESVRGEL